MAIDCVQVKVTADAVVKVTKTCVRNPPLRKVVLVCCFDVGTLEQKSMLHMGTITPPDDDARLRGGGLRGGGGLRKRHGDRRM